MTTTPIDARRNREARYPGSATALTRTIGYGILTLLGGALAAVGIGGFTGQFRTMEILGINETSEWLDNGVPFGVFIPAAIASIPVLLFTRHRYIRWNRRYSGRDDRLIVVGPFSLVLIGSTAALWWICQVLWREPSPVGFTDGDAWGRGTWICHRMKTWLPALPTSLTVIGRITEVSGVPGADASQTGISWTCQFTDSDGQSRWLERFGFSPATRYPSVGGEVWILYDPAAPADTSRIFTCLPDPSMIFDEAGPDDPSYYLTMDTMETTV